MEGRNSQEEVMRLTESALSARKNAYCPYSHFAVGAALLAADGLIYSGCNVENASFGATNCAERSAFFKAISAGQREFIAIAIAGGIEEDEPKDYVYPCGICRQVMQEFCGEDFPIILVKSPEDYQIHCLNELLPNGFGGASLQ